MSLERGIEEKQKLAMAYNEKAFEILREVFQPSYLEKSYLYCKVTLNKFIILVSWFKIDEAKRLFGYVYDCLWV